MTLKRPGFHSIYISLLFITFHKVSQQRYLRNLPNFQNQANTRCCKIFFWEDRIINIGWSSSMLGFSLKSAQSVKGKPSVFVCVCVGGGSTPFHRVGMFFLSLEWHFKLSLCWTLHRNKSLDKINFHPRNSKSRVERQIDAIWKAELCSGTISDGMPAQI